MAQVETSTAATPEDRFVSNPDLRPALLQEIKKLS